MSPIEQFEVRVDVSIVDRNNGGRLQISESVTIQSVSFLELAAIHGEFHKVAEKLKAEKS